MLVLAANEVRVILPCDSEIDLILADCFTPPMMKSDPRTGRSYEYGPGIAAYRATCDILKRVETKAAWLRLWLPVPEYDREWFRNLKPQTKQPGFLWIARNMTLNDYLVDSRHATRVQPKPSEANYDGDSAVVNPDD